MNTNAISIKRLKQRAKTLKKNTGITHSQALDKIAQSEGFHNWKDCQKELTQRSQLNIPSPKPSLNFTADEDVELDDSDFETLDNEREDEHPLNVKLIVNRNIKVLINLGIEFTTFEPTETGFKKSIIDATQPVRTLFEIDGFHIYSQQNQGPESKVLKNAFLLEDDSTTNSVMSLYRPRTKKGDPRMWFTGLKKIAAPKDIIAIIIFEESAYLINLSKVDLQISLDCLNSEIGKILRTVSAEEHSIALELLNKLKFLAKKPIKSLRDGDTGIGYTIETLLEIQANSSKTPDYKGIEIKSGRGTKNRTTLFAQVADWSSSPCKSSAQILNKYGYERDDEFKLYCTVSTQKENSQKLRFIYDSDKDELQEWYDSSELVAVWPGAILRARLKEKHTETFWIRAESISIDGHEYFKLESVTYTKRPILSQLMSLVQAGVITMDHLIKRNSKGRISEKGPLFKINKSDLNLLFPKPETFRLN